MDGVFPESEREGLIAAMGFGHGSQSHHRGAEHFGGGSDAEAELANDVARVRLGAEFREELSGEAVGHKARPTGVWGLRLFLFPLYHSHSQTVRSAASCALKFGDKEKEERGKTMPDYAAPRR